MLNRKPAVTVLSVSPYEGDHQLLRSIVSRSNWGLLCASDCHDAWRLVHSTPVTVIITESHFPDGFSWRELTEEIGNMEEAPAVIVAAAKENDAVWEQAIAGGAFDVLVKPFHPDDVRRAISTAWQKSRDARLLRSPLRVQHRKPAMGAAAI
jgi:DNA-binding NtrC family response regulator